jgi:lysophospholipase L1-like esterase
MSRLSRLAPLAVLLLAPANLPADGGGLKLKKGERIVFLGDSITQAGVGPKGYVTLVRKALDEKHGGLGVTVIGAGISGNKVPDLQKRLARDVLKRKPTLVVIYIGINDVWHGLANPANGTPKDRFESGLEDVIGRIQAQGARVVLCTPSVIGEKPDGSNTGDARLDEYSQISRRVARKMKVPVCDLRKAFVDYLKKNNKAGKAREVLTTDGVHLNEAGNRFVADQVLKELGAG